MRPNLVRIPIKMTTEMELIHKKLLEFFQHRGYQLIQLCTECRWITSLDIEHITQRFCVDLQQRLIGEMKQAAYESSRFHDRPAYLISLNAQVLKLIGHYQESRSRRHDRGAQNITQIFEKVSKQKGSKADFFLPRWRNFGPFMDTYSN